MICYVNEVLML